MLKLQQWLKYKILWTSLLPCCSFLKQCRGTNISRWRFPLGCDFMIALCTLKSRPEEPALPPPVSFCIPSLLLLWLCGASDQRTGRIDMLGCGLGFVLTSLHLQVDVFPSPAPSTSSCCGNNKYVSVQEGKLHPFSGNPHLNQLITTVKPTF